MTNDSDNPPEAGAEDSIARPESDLPRPSHVVGIGASAGGLEALERFFRAMPVDSGMAFVVIQHLSPDFKSLMDELLERFTHELAGALMRRFPLRSLGLTAWKSIAGLLPAEIAVRVEMDRLALEQAQADEDRYND